MVNPLRDMGVLMNSNNCRACLLATFVFLFSNVIFAQQPVPVPLEQAYNNVKSVYGLNPGVINGKYFENIYRNDIGHPFYLTDNFLTGYIIIHNIKLVPKGIRYNIYDQSLSVDYESVDKSSLVFIPPNEFIEAFGIDGKKFTKCVFSGGQSGYYEDIYKGKELIILSGLAKKRYDSYHNKTFKAYKFSKLRESFYLVLDDSVYLFRSNRNFVGLFQMEYRKGIMNYLRKNKIKLRKGDSQKIAELGLYCDKILGKAKKLSQEVSSETGEKYVDLPFDEFVNRLEEETSLRLFYHSELAKNIQVSSADPEADVFQQLTGILKPNNINYFKDQNENIILYSGNKIIEEIPDYRQISNSASDSASQAKNKLTSAELKYIEGKKEIQLEVLTIGNPGEMVNGKSRSIRGRVFDNASGEPLIGATIYLKELEIGAATDIDGHFNLFVKQGKYLVTASSLSMRERSFYIQVYSDGSLSIPLEKELVSINEVRIIAERNHNVTGIQMGFERITNRSMKEIPVVMGEKDILKVAQMLPGVQSAGEGSSGLIVRGGSADQNLFYINKMPIYNTSHLFGFFSAFSPDIVNNFTLYKSNIPAEYGGRVSSVFDIATRQGNKKKFFGKGGISPVTGHFAVEGPIVKDKSSFVFSYRGTYSDWILSRVDDINLRNSKGSFYDMSGIINTEINEKNLLKAFVYRSEDQFSLSTTNDYNYSNTGGTISWKHKFSSTISEFTAVFSQYTFGHNDKSNPTEAYTHNYQLNHTELKADFLYLTGNRHRISYGVNSIFYNLDRGEVLPFGSESRRISINLGIENAVEAAVYLSDEYKIIPRLTLLAGIRYSFYSLLGPQQINEYIPGLPKDKNSILSELSFTNNEIVNLYHGPEPRIALNYVLGLNNSIKASYNRIRQYIFLLSNTIAIAPNDQWKLSDYHIKPQIADQVSLGYYHNFYKQGLSSSVEVYKKWVDNVVEYKDDVDFISSNPAEMLLLQGDQDIYGMEIMLKKDAGRLTGWLSYSYSRSFIKVVDELTNEQINNGKIYPSNYDKPHSLNFVSNLKISRRISLSAVLVYSTGRPITYPASIYYSGGKEILHYSERNEYRIPDYFRMDFSINYEGNLFEKKWLHSSWMLNVYNLTGRKNAYSVFFEADDGIIQGYKLSVFGQPIVTLTWNFKFGNYVSD